MILADIADSNRKQSGRVFAFQLLSRTTSVVFRVLVFLASLICNIVLRSVPVVAYPTGVEF